ncbi:MAG: BREX system P-loop protein BrxC [Shewanella sp.]|uniref:BREX system P-loop protein BrxC n=1 Tax=Shewanella sp. TaxID=50422 RepID=UPI003F414274
MQVKELFSKQLDRSINGVVKADQLNEQIIWSELDEYVVTRELDKHFRHFFENYLPGVNNPDDPSVAGKVGIWVSGFFGSGKSHFIKILSYLLSNQHASNADSSKSAIEFFKEKISDSLLYSDIHAAVNRSTDVILFNIDSRADTNDKEDAILKVFLRVFNERLGYCGDHPHIANFERELDALNQYQAFKDKFLELSGETWEEVRDSYLFRIDPMAQAWSQVTGQSEASAQHCIEHIESMFTLDISNFCKWVREYLKRCGDEQRIVFLVDEVGQFIGNNTQMMLKLQTITENLGTACGGRAWVIVTSQEDIDAVLGDLSSKNGQDFSKIQGRFHTRISLSSSNTNEVIQKRLLQKTPQAKDALADLFAHKGDVLRNQLAFDNTTTAELANYSDSVEFVDHYPFIPYQYTLIQKVFEAIRKVGATGKHLSRGERSLLDAFQNAARQQMDKETGVLVPFHAFYTPIESFLDTNVKRIFEQASENKALQPCDVQLLKGLFLIRYVDLVKSTLDNLVTLSIEEIDTDKITLRKNIEASLERLEQQMLIVRNGDQYVFLTNEEKEIEQEIRHTQVEATESTRHLAQLIFDEVLASRRQYRYPVNKQDFPISRFCNGHPQDGQARTDLILKVISPLDANYDDYHHQGCLKLSEDCVLLRLPDDTRLWREFTTWQKTAKYLASHDSKRSDQQKLLAEKALENTQRRQNLKNSFETLVKAAKIFALGQELNIKASSVINITDEAFKYVIENSFQKLNMLKSCGMQPTQELKSVLSADDVGQLNLHLGERDPNAEAKQELIGHLVLIESSNQPLYFKALLERFSSRPYGWNRDEVMLQVAHLVLQGKVALSTPNGDLPLNRSYDHFTSVRNHANLRLRSVRQHSDMQITKAARLAKELFQTPFDAQEKELAEKLIAVLNEQQRRLADFEFKAKQCACPGQAVLQQGRQLIDGLLAHSQQSYALIESLCQQENELLDFAEDFEDVAEFFSRQFDAWQQLHRALHSQFAINRDALDNDAQAAELLAKLQAIYSDQKPYSKLREITPLIAALSQIHQRLIEQARAQAQTEIARQQQAAKHLIGDLPADEQNQAMRPFVLLQGKADKCVSLHEFISLKQQAEDEEENVIALVNHYITQQKPISPPSDSETLIAPVVVKVKPIEQISPSELFGDNAHYIESETDIEQYLAKLRAHLQQAIHAGKRVRIK